jgi:hypothetical protein
MDVSKRRLAWPQWLGAREILIVLLLAGAAAMAWTIDAQAREIAVLETDLTRERQAHAVARLSLNTAEFRAANRELETEVRRDILDERLVEQAGRAEQLEREAEELRRQLVREANCVTPRRIREAEGL